MTLQVVLNEEFIGTYWRRRDKVAVKVTAILVGFENPVLAVDAEGNTYRYDERGRWPGKSGRHPEELVGRTLSETF